MLDPSFSELLRTRLLVAALGESLASPWWRTHFLQSTGLSRLERIVPRTFRLAALEGATAAARRDHDALVAPHSYHLFRLPSAVEHRLRATAESAAAENAALLSVPATTDELLKELSPANAAAPTKDAPGPRRIANVNELFFSGVLPAISGAYAHAARTSVSGN